MNLTTPDNLPAPIQATLANRMLSIPTPHFIHTIPAQREKMPREGGMYLRFRRYNTLTDATAPLDYSGVDPAAEALSANNVDAQLKTYAKIVAIHEIVTLTAQDKPLNQAVNLLGLNLASTEDKLMKKVLETSPSTINCTLGSNGRIVAVLKSFLMGLKLLAGNAEDNKAELYAY